MRTYRAGILGNCCTHGAGLCAGLKGHPRVEAVAAYEPDARRARELEDALGAPLASSYEAVLDAPALDFVAITCDPCDKAMLAEMAAGAGKHILLNKPFADSLDNARRIARAVKEKGVWLVHDIPMVRGVPVFARLLDEMRAGDHGAVMGYHHLFGMNFPPAFDLAAAWPERLDQPAKSGGGEMTNMGCYAIDFAVAALGMPRAVTAKRRSQWDIYAKAGVESFGQIILDYGPFYAFLEVGKQQLQGEHRHSNALTVNFEHTTFHIDASAGQAAVNHVPRDFGTFAAGATAVGSVDQLIAAMETNTPPASNAESGVQATEVLMAAYASIVEERTMTLPLASGANPLVSVAQP